MLRCDEIEIICHFFSTQSFKFSSCFLPYIINQWNNPTEEFYTTTGWECHQAGAFKKDWNENILTVSFQFFQINAVIIAVSRVASEKFDQNKLYKYELNCRQTPDTKWDLEPSARSGALF